MHFYAKMSNMTKKYKLKLFLTWLHVSESDNRNFWNNRNLVIHSSASFNYFTFTSFNDLSKWLTLLTVFVKSSRFCVWIIRFCSDFTSSWYKYLLRNYKYYYRLKMFETGTVTRKSLNVKFTVKKIDVAMGIVCNDADADIKSEISFVIL